MTNTTTPYNISVTETERRKSCDSSTSELSAIHHQASNASSVSTSSVPIPSAYARSSLGYDEDAPPPYSEKAGVDKDERDAVKKMEDERKMRIRDYAVEISRLMGRQLVNGLKGGTAKSNAHPAVVGEPDGASH